MSKKERRSVPVLRFKGFTDDWEQRKLGDIANVYDGTHTTPDYQKNGIMFLSVENIDTLTSKKFITKSDYLENYKHKPEYHDIFMTRIGSIGKTNILETHDPRAFYVSLALIKPKDIDPYYLKYWLSSNTTQKEIWRRTLQIAFPQKINKDEISKVQSSISKSKNEQYNIGQLLNKIDHLLLLQQRKLEYYRKLKKHLSNKVFSTENYGATVTLGKIFNTVTDYVANGSFKSLRENVKTYSNKNYAYLIRLQDASNNWQGPWLYTDKKGYDFLKKSKLRPGDIIMANVGSVGKVFQVPDLSYPMTLAPNAILLRSKAANNAFLFEFLRSDYGQNLVRKMTTPGVQNKINKTDFKKITIRLPKKEIQDKWASLFESLNQIELGQLSSISNLKEIRKFLLQNMFI